MTDSVHPDRPSDSVVSAAPQTVYAKVRDEERTCEYGYKHRIRLVRAKVIYPTDRTWPMNNGYEKRQEAVYEDEDGREYRRMVTIDYADNVFWLDPDNGHWRPRMASGDVLTDE